MNKNYEIEELPALVKKGILTANQAKDLLWSDMYLNPHKYGLEKLDEDDKSDYLLSLNKKLTSVFEEFIPGKIKFNSYIRGCIKQSIMSFFRKKYKKIAELRCLDQQTKIDEEDTNASNLPEIHSLYGESRNFTFTGSKRKENLTKKVLKIAVYKAATELDFETLRNIAGFLEENPENFIKEISEIREKSFNQTKTKSLIITRRNKAFYYRKKCLYELSRLPENSFIWKQLKARYDRQTEKWLKNNNILRSRFKDNVPNSLIAEKTGIQRRKISLYLSHAKRRTDLLSQIVEIETKSEE